MDCEKFEPLLLDELYEELDELTSAAVKRHVSGCARCASVLNGMRATRRVAALPMMAVPDGLEDRILASVKEAQKVVPMKSRMSRAVSVAGRWAMRPQTAMAAVFLLMIGSSAVFLRSKTVRSEAASVSDFGAPAVTVAQTQPESLNNAAASAAHGAMTLPPAAAPMATAPAPLAFAANEEPAAGAVDRLTGGAGRDGKKDDKALAALVQTQQEAQTRGATATLRKDGDEPAKEKAEGKPAPAATAMARSGPRAGEAESAPLTNAGTPGGAPAQDYGGQQAFGGSQNAYSNKGASPQDGYSAGMAAYRARKYDEATRQFDSAAGTGDLNAALWAAKAVKAGNGGCSVALGRFDGIAQKTPGTQTGNEALLEGADCQIELGQLEAARARLAALLNTSTHRAQAQQGMAKLAVAERQRSERSGGGSGGAVAAPKAARPAAAPPAPAPMRKAAKPADNAAVDSAK